MLEIVKVSSKGQIVIPEKIRTELGIEEGTTLVLIEDSGKIILEKENVILQKLQESEERKTWIKLGEIGFTKTWDNPKDEAAWKKYL